MKVTHPLLLIWLLACEPKGGTPEQTAHSPDEDGDGFDSTQDCDDADPTIHPEAAELCDGIDQDCDGTADEEAINTVQVYADVDGDSFGDPSSAHEACTPAGDEVTNDTDCDDDAPLVNPAATEVCNDLDDDCDALTDDEDDSLDLASASTWYGDTDGDGFGDADIPLLACLDPGGASANALDCDDGNPMLNPEAAEACDEIDNDCDDLVDDADDSLDLDSAATGYTDGDGDGFGDADSPLRACALPAGSSADATDCDDTADSIHPAATEICDGVDNDCDDLVDDEDGSLDLATASTWYADGDGDGFGDVALPVLACLLPPGASADATDCDDGADFVFPTATETCDGVDEDCDGLADDEDGSLDLATASTWYADADGDGFGDAASPLQSCLLPGGATADGTDCDDHSATTSPAITETCSGIDDDCDGLVDDADPTLDLGTATTWYADADGDGHGDPLSSSVSCDQPAGGVVSDDDCEAADPSVYPGAADSCEDGIDQDCSGADRSCSTLSGEVDPDTAYTTVIYSTESSGVLGSAFDVLDWNADGQDDLILSAAQSDLYTTDSGRVWVYLGPLSPGAQAEVNGYAVAYYGTTSNARVGGSVSTVNDLDGDGDDEVYILSSTSSSSARKEQGLVLGGTIVGDIPITSALLFNVTCYGATGGGDPDGDGTNGWTCGDASSTLSWYEGTDTTSSMAISGTVNTGFGSAPVLDQDLDGDGINDIWLGAPRENSTAADTGAAYFFSGPFQTMTKGDADLTIVGVLADQQLGSGTRIADLDGDGTPEFLAGSAYDDTGGTNAGAYWGWRRPLSASTTASAADFTIYGDAAGEYFGSQPPGLDDVDGDGVVDFVFSSNVAPGGGTSRGELWLFYGPLAGTFDLSSAVTDGAHMQGDVDQDYLGAKHRLGPDLLGDGAVDLLFGAHGAGWAGSATSGVFYILESDG